MSDLDIKAEVEKLRESREKWLASTTRPHDPKTEAEVRRTIEWLDDDTPEKYRMFSATLDYMATGEGRTMAFVAQGHHSKRQFMEHLIGKWRGYYYVCGAKLHEGMPVDDEIYDFLFSDKMRYHMSTLPYFETSLWQHFNFS